MLKISTSQSQEQRLPGANCLLYLTGINPIFGVTLAQFVHLLNTFFSLARKASGGRHASRKVES